MIKVLMKPHLSEIGNAESGIHSVIRKYFQHLGEFDIDLVSPDSTSYDVTAAHAGITGGDTMVCHAHGLYWSADVPCDEWEWHVNSRVIEAIRNAKEITVPSEWVNETFKRELRRSAHVIPHGIDWQEWQHKEDNQGYVLWAKNRVGDVCDNSVIDILMRRFPDIGFVSTFTTPSLRGLPFEQWPKNFKIIETGGKTPHLEMRRFVQQSGVYLSTTRETFGIGILEAMASGKPVLGWAGAGNSILVQHGVNGYLAKPGDIDDLCEGLAYCVKHRKVLGANGSEMAKQWTWAKACELVAGVYRLAMEEEPATVSVVIPVYNKTKIQLNTAVHSAQNQTLQPKEIIVIDDGSSPALVEEDFIFDNWVRFIRQSNQGVANARNNGIALTTSKYVTCLDADDWIEQTFLETCVKALESDRSLGIAYTGLMSHNADGSSSISPWPGPFNPDKQLSYPKQNQIPTTCVFQRDAWQRVGGYKSRYAPLGAGSEDAALWSAICSIGYNARKVTDEPLFNYSMQGGSVHDNPEYSEVDWLSMYPWAKDGLHPFASVATPKRYSHPVRQFDQPLISVVIPVGPGHEKEVANALDSLEMQHFRRWEVILSWDTGDSRKDEWTLPSGTKASTHDYSEEQKRIYEAYPYIRSVTTASIKGAGIARNLGVKLTRAPLIFFLDADDVLVDPHAFDKLIQAWNENEAVIYSDYLGKAVWDYEAAQKEFGDNLLSYNQRNQTAVFKKQSQVFDPAMAQRQPELNSLDANMPYYHWCLVSVLIPKVWHDAIGGFDETMETWEDVDYMWRLTRAGRCFYRVSDPLVMYSYHKGHRREKSAVTNEDSRQKHQSMIQYIKRKYEGIKTVMCNCGGRRPASQQTSGEGESVNGLNDQEMVMVEFDFPGSATRDTLGHDLKSITGQTLNGQRLNYQGYGRRKGDRFLVHVKDQRARPDMFKLVSEIQTPEVEMKPLDEPVLLVQEKRRRTSGAAKQESIAA